MAISPRNGQEYTRSRDSSDSVSVLSRALRATEPITRNSLPHLQSPPFSLCLTLGSPRTPGGRRQQATGGKAPTLCCCSEKAWGAVEKRGKCHRKEVYPVLGGSLFGQRV